MLSGFELYPRWVPLKYAYIYLLNAKIRSTMLCLSGFELYSRWVPLIFVSRPTYRIVYTHYTGWLFVSSRKPIRYDVNIALESAVCLRFEIFGSISLKRIMYFYKNCIISNLQRVL